MRGLIEGSVCSCHVPVRLTNVCQQEVGSKGAVHAVGVSLGMHTVLHVDAPIDAPHQLGSKRCKEGAPDFSSYQPAPQCPSHLSHAHLLEAAGSASTTK